MSIKTAIEYTGGTNGLKTILGATIIVLAGQLGVVNDIAPLFPDNQTIQSIAGGLKEAIDVTQAALRIVGSSFMGIGLFDKALKLVGVK